MEKEVFIPIKKLFEAFKNEPEYQGASDVDYFVYAKREDGITEETIKVTIALEEYRSLVSENARMKERLAYLENRLFEEIKKNAEAVNDGKM